MKIGEVLHALANLVDTLEQDKTQDVENDSGFSADSDQEQKPMLPPLQQKQELLKRAVEVDNVYDDEYADQVHPDSELNTIKKNAGLMASVMHSDDGPMDG